jgi:hypothetical protein
VRAVPAPRQRSPVDVRRELEATEQRFVALFAKWRDGASSQNLPADGVPPRALVDSAEELLRHQRGAIDHMHQLWIEYAQLSGLHAPQ